MNSTLLRLSAQALLGRRRFVVLILVPGILLLLAAVVRALAGEGVAYTGIVEELGAGTALPIIALLAASAVLGPEIDDGSVVYLLAKPVSRRVVAASKYIVAMIATLVFGALPVLALGMIIDGSDPGRAVAWTLAGAVSAAAYSALFLALSAVTRHGIIVGVLYVFLWEGLLSSLFSGVRWLSVDAWTRQIAHAIDDGIVLTSGVGVTYAVAASALAVVAGVWFAGQRLRSFTLRGED